MTEEDNSRCEDDSMDDMIWMFWNLEHNAQMFEVRNPKTNQTKRSADEDVVKRIYGSCLEFSHLEDEAAHGQRPAGGKALGPWG